MTLAINGAKLLAGCTVDFLLLEEAQTEEERAQKLAITGKPVFRYVNTGLVL